MYHLSTLAYTPDVDLPAPTPFQQVASAQSLVTTSTVTILSCSVVGKEHGKINKLGPILPNSWANLKILKVHKIEIFFGFDFEICIISLLFMSKY
jgi:hypothetical protein